MEDIGIKLLFKTRTLSRFCKVRSRISRGSEHCEKAHKVPQWYHCWTLCSPCPYRVSRIQKWLCPRWYPNMQKYLYNRHVPLLLPYISDVLVPSNFNNPMFVCPSATWEWDPINGLRNPQSGWRKSGRYTADFRDVTNGIGKLRKSYN